MDGGGGGRAFVAKQLAQMPGGQQPSAPQPPRFGGFNRLKQAFGPGTQLGQEWQQFKPQLMQGLQQAGVNTQGRFPVMRQLFGPNSQMGREWQQMKSQIPPEALQAMQGWRAKFRGGQ